MYSNESAAGLKAALENFIKDRGFELVEFKLCQRGRESYLALLVDIPGDGISLAGCAVLNRQIKDFIEAESLLAEPYTLEVSSPGIDRNLALPRDFLRALNRKIRVFLKEPVSGKLEFSGKLIEAGQDRISLEAENSVVISVFLSNIMRAKQII